MSTLGQLQTILRRLSNYPVSLARTEIQMFVELIRRDPSLFGILDKIEQENKDKLGGGPFAATLVKNAGNSGLEDLSFADTPALRATAGFQVCVNLLSECPDPKSFQTRLIVLGAHYAATTQAYRPNPDPSSFLALFATVFLSPLISYLESLTDWEDRMLMLMSRYSQRAEWFFDESELESAIQDSTRLEKALQKDLLKYLFDNGVALSIESESPMGRGKADVLPMIQGVGLIPIEVKVFKDKRSKDDVEKGLAQAAAYGRQFNQPAYYLIYNIMVNTIVSVEGEHAASNVVKTNIGNVRVYSAVANIWKTLPSSASDQLKHVRIQAPPIS